MAHLPFEPTEQGISDQTWRRVMSPDEKSLEETRQFWSKQYGRELTTADAAEIHHNLFGLVKLLFEIDARQQKIKAGVPVIDEQKVSKLRWDIRRLEDQIKGLGKMIGRWSKGDPQRKTLEETRGALEKQLAEAQRALHEEITHPSFRHNPEKRAAVASGDAVPKARLEEGPPPT